MKEEVLGLRGRRNESKRSQLLRSRVLVSPPNGLIHMDSAIKFSCSTVLTLCLLCLVSLSAIAAAPPSNDTCAGRVTIPGNGPFPFKTTTVDISGATITGDPPFPTCATEIASSVWYEFRPQAAGLYTISTC